MAGMALARRACFGESMMRALTGGVSVIRGGGVGESGWGSRGFAYTADTAEGQEHQTTEKEFPSISVEEILDKALEHVPSTGWTMDSARLAAQDKGYSIALAAILPRGRVELVEHFVKKCNANLAESLRRDHALLMAMPVEDRLTRVLFSRLEMIQPHLKNWHTALAVQMHPLNASHSFNNLSKMVDDVWRTCGDNSSDLRWYAKRAVLGKVYTSAEIYMLTDYSPGLADTRSFLERSISNVGAHTGLLKEA